MLIDLTRRTPTILYDVEPSFVIVRVASLGDDSAWVREQSLGVVDGEPTQLHGISDRPTWSSNKDGWTWVHHVAPAPGARDERLTYECSTMRFEVEPPQRDGPAIPWEGQVAIERIASGLHYVVVVGPEGMECQCRVKGLVTLAYDDDEMRTTLWERLGASNV